MKNNSYRLAVVVGLLVCLTMFVLPTAAQNRDRDFKVIERDAIAFGRTYADWSVSWQQWADSIPVANHPLFDNGDCSVGQSGPVWFLGGKFCANNATNCGYTNVIRSCSLPSDKALYVAVFNSEDSALEDPANTQVAQLRGFSESMMDLTGDLTLEVDGVAIPNLKKRFRVQSNAFSFTLPEDNLFKAIYGSANFAAGTYFPAVDEGVYVMLAPLPAGNHVVHLRGSLPSFNFTMDVTYYLAVAH